MNERTRLIGKAAGVGALVGGVCTMASVAGGFVAVALDGVKIEKGTMAVVTIAGGFAGAGLGAFTGFVVAKVVLRALEGAVVVNPVVAENAVVATPVVAENADQTVAP